MGLVWNRRKRIGKDTTLNLSKSGASVSRRAGRFTVNSRGRLTIRLGSGFSFRL